MNSSALLYILYFMWCAIHSAHSATTIQPDKDEQTKTEEDKEPVHPSSQSPLLLTKFIESGSIQEGREAAKVDAGSFGFESVESYSGYFTVDEKKVENLFFWYFPAESVPKEAPVVLWLQGGPASSSMMGLLKEHGPFDLKGATVKLREYRWTKHSHMIYMDNPVGAGFSFPEPLKPTLSEEEISGNLYNALVQFFQLFPHLTDNEFFLAGESYAGLFVPALGYTIHRNNKIADQKINLKGLAIGNGKVDPRFEVYGDYLAQHGLIDTAELAIFLEREKEYRQALIEQNYKAADDYDQFYWTAMTEKTGVSEYNYLKTDLERLRSRHTWGINSRMFFRKVGSAIHTGNVAYRSLGVKAYYAVKDGTRYLNTSVYTAAVLEHYRVLLFAGQLDIILHYPMIQKHAEALEWSGSHLYRESKRKEWFVDGEFAGFVKSGGNLTLVMVRNAGHQVAVEQPKWAYDLIHKFLGDDIDALSSSIDIRQRKS